MTCQIITDHQIRELQCQLEVCDAATDALTLSKLEGVTKYVGFI